MNTPDSSGWSQRTQRGIAGVGEGRLRDEERDPARVDRLAVGEARRARRRRPAPAAGRAISGAELALDDQLREVLVGQPLARRPARVGRRGERRQDVVVEEVGERPVADVVEEPGDPERLDDQALGRRRLAGRERASPAATGRASGPTARPRA